RPSAGTCSPSRWCGCPRYRCPATRVSGSACPATGSGTRLSSTGRTSCTWPARCSWAPTAPRWPDGSGCRRSPCTRPTCRLTPAPTGSAFAWRWLRGIHNSTARTLAPSTVTAAGLHARGIGNVWLWGRGVDTKRFHPARRSPELRAALAPDGELIVGYVGRLATEKRVELLAGITGLARVRLVIVGAGPAEGMLRQHMPDATFLGERRGAELAAIYASLDVFVHSGPYETFGQTLQEAAASGLPVLAPAAGGPLDLVQHGVTGYLVRPAEGGAFSFAVARLAADPAARAAFGAAGRRKVLSRSWPALTGELVGHYAAVLGRTATAKVSM